MPWRKKSGAKKHVEQRENKTLEKEQVFNPGCLQGQKCACCERTWSTQVIFTRGEQLVILEALFQGDQHEQLLLSKVGNRLNYYIEQSLPAVNGRDSHEWK